MAPPCDMHRHAPCPPRRRTKEKREVVFDRIFIGHSGIHGLLLRLGVDGHNDGYGVAPSQNGLK